METYTASARVATSDHQHAQDASGARTGPRVSLMASRGSATPQRSPTGAVAEWRGGRVAGLCPAPSADPLISAFPLSIHEDIERSPCQNSTCDSISTDSDLKREKLPDKLKRYAKAHGRALEMAEHVGGRAFDTSSACEARQLLRRSEKLQSCGHWLTFRDYFTVREVRLHAATFCQLEKLCPLCAIRRGAKLLKKYTERVLTVLEEEPDLVPVHVVTTVKNGPDFSERFNHHRAALGQLLKRRKDGLRNRSRILNQASHAAGGVSSYEFKRGEGTRGGWWHPHNHAVWLCKKIPDQEQLGAEWKQLTGDSHIVHVEPFYFVQRGERPTQENLVRDFSEVFKYALKFSSMSCSDNLFAADALHRRRLVDSFGCLKGVTVPDHLTDEPLATDLPFIELLFGFNSGAYHLTNL